MWFQCSENGHASAGILKKLQKREYDLWYQSNLDASSKHQFGHMDRAAMYALRLVSVVPENAAKAQRKKATLQLYICGCFCMLGVDLVPETDTRQHNTIQS